MVVRCPGTCIDGGSFCMGSVVIWYGVVAGKFGVVAAEELII